MFAVSRFSGTELGLNKINRSSNSSATDTLVPPEAEGTPILCLWSAAIHFARISPLTFITDT